jgi:hypothetical protein
MAGIRVPNADYEAPTPQPEMAQVPMPKQPVANPNMFGVAQAEAGEKVGAKVQAGAIDIADRLIQQKMWIQQANLYEDKEGFRADQVDILHNDRMKTVIDPDTNQEIQIPDGLLDRQGKWATGIADEYSQRMTAAMQANSPKEPELLELNKTRQRLFGSVYAGGLSSVSDWQSRQQKAYVNDTLTASTANAVASGGNVKTIPDLMNVLHEVSDSTMKQGAYAGLPPEEIQKNQQKAYKQTVLNATIGGVTNGMSNDDAQAMLGATSKFLASEDLNEISDKVEKAAIGYSKAQEKLADIKQQGNNLQFIKDMANGVVGLHNQGSINGLPIDDKLKMAASASINAHPIGLNAQQAQKPEDINIKELQGRMAQNKQFLSKQNEIFANHLVALAKAPSSNALVDEAVKIFNSKATGKITQEQQNIAAQLLTMRGQYMPVKADADEGKEPDPNQIAVTAGIKTLTDYGKDKPGFTGLIKDYTTAMQAPNSDSTQAMTGAMRNHALQLNPKLANIPEGGITGSDKYGNRRTVFPDLHVEIIKSKSSGDSSGKSTSNSTSAS